MCARVRTPLKNARSRKGNEADKYGERKKKKKKER